METIRIGGLWDGETKHQAGSVWDTQGLSPTIDTMLGGGREPHIMEIWNVRNIYINSREGRRAWSVENRCDTPYRNWGGIAHTLTCRDGTLCVQHCNLVIEVEKLEDIKQLGKLEEGSSQRRIVYDSENISPTLQAAMGSDGGNVPMVVERTEVKEMGFIDKGTGKHQSNVVYDKEGLSPCICAALGVKKPPTMTVEQTCVAMRGRNPENPSDRTKGIELEQKVEAPKKIKIRQATKQGFIECEIGGAVDLDYPSSQTRRARVIEKGKLSPTLTTENIPNVIELGNPDFYNFLYEIDGEIYLIRIRKLIPLECWRLMGFTDEDFYKAEAVNSNTQLYKESGNAIVVDCLEALMRQMNIQGIKTWNELTDEERKAHDDKKHNYLRKDNNCIE